MIKYSIIVPIFNAQDTLCRCLDSVVSQNRDDLELILVNDGSTDDSESICRAYQSRYDYIKILSQENHGASASRNLGLAVVQGEYILFLDSDDCYDPSSLSCVDAALQETPIDLIQFSTYIVNRGKTNRRALKPYLGQNRLEAVKKAAELLCHRRLNSPVGKVYRRALIEENGICFPEELTLGEDGIFNLRYLMHADSYRVLPEPIYWVYAESFRSLSRRRHPTLDAELETFTDIATQLVDQSNLEPEEKELLRQAINFDELRNIYTKVKLFHRYGMRLPERWRNIGMLCRTQNRKHSSYPAALYTRMLALPIQLHLTPLVDLIGWKMAYLGIVRPQKGQLEAEQSK